MSIILNRILFGIATHLELSDPLLDRGYKYLCRQILISLSYIGERGPIYSSLFSSQVALALGGLNETERAYMLDFLRKTNIYKQRLPKDSSALEKLVLEIGRAMTGQGTFHHCVCLMLNRSGSEGRVESGVFKSQLLNILILNLTHAPSI